MAEVTKERTEQIYKQQRAISEPNAPGLPNIATVLDFMVEQQKYAQYSKKPGLQQELSEAQAPFISILTKLFEKEADLPDEFAKEIIQQLLPFTPDIIIGTKKGATLTPEQPNFDTTNVSLEDIGNCYASVEPLPGTKQRGKLRSSQKML